MKTTLAILQKLYTIQSKSGYEEEIISFLCQYIKSLDENIQVEVKNKNIYVVKGNAEKYPCIVCHTDQVQEINKNITILMYKDILFGYDFTTKKRVGLGADDKNGIFMALMALEWFPELKACFFYSEEIGCVGSKACDLSFFDNCYSVVECDRKGSSDFIIQGSGIDLSSEEFEEACCLEQFGYKECNGASTDVVELKRKGLNISCCNLSCGYYNPHSSEEYTNLTDLKKCWELTKHILSLHTVYEHKYVAKAVTTNYSYKNLYSGWNYHDYNYNYSSYNQDNKQSIKHLPPKKKEISIYDKIEEYIIKHIFCMEYDLLYAQCVEIEPTLTEQEFYLIYLHCSYKEYQFY